MKGRFIYSLVRKLISLVHIHSHKRLVVQRFCYYASSSTRAHSSIVMILIRAVSYIYSLMIDKPPKLEIDWYIRKGSWNGV
jgi:hypothetical protein